MTQSAHQTTIQRHAPVRAIQPVPDTTTSSTILSAVGRTPLLPLPRLGAWAGLPDGTTIYAKAEHLNPGGSCKDRLANALIDSAEARGARPGDLLVEATSGNTGIALAQAAAVRGYRLLVVASEKVSSEKVRILTAYGAQVERVPNVPHGDPLHYIERAKALALERGGHYLDQFGNPANVQVHERITGPELLRQIAHTGRALSAFVAGVGTGGTLTGIARHLRRAAPDARIILADPVGSVLAAGHAFAPYRVEGIGDDVHPALYEDVLVDGAVHVDDETSFTYARAAAQLEGLLVGGSSGAHLAASVAVAKRLPPGSTVCTILPDTGRNYLTTFLDPQWCHTHGHSATFSPGQHAPDATEVHL